MSLLIAARRIGDLAAGERTDGWILFTAAAAAGFVVGWILLLMSKRRSTTGVPSRSVQISLGVAAYGFYSIFSGTAPLVVVVVVGLLAGILVAVSVWVLVQDVSSEQ